jgi:hypothetical protein
MPGLKQIDAAFVECRARRHRWDPIPDDGGLGRKYKASRSVRRLTMRCERCHCKRYEAWNKLTGDIIFVSYEYPEGYSLAGQEVKPWDIRREYLLRLDRQEDGKLGLT